MNVMYVRTSENQLPSKAYIRETLLQISRGVGLNNTFSHEGARKYLPRLISRESFLKFNPCEHSRNRIVIILEIYIKRIRDEGCLICSNILALLSLINLSNVFIPPRKIIQ